MERVSRAPAGPCGPRRSIRSAARTVPGFAWSRADSAASRRCSGSVGDQPTDRAGQLRVVGFIRRQARAEPGLGQSLGVVDLVPEEGQDDHRLAVVERLGDRVVAAVGDHEVDLGDDRRLGQERFAGHVVGQPELVGQRALADDHPVSGFGRARRRGAASRPHRPSRGCPVTGTAALHRAGPSRVRAPPGASMTRSSPGRTTRAGARSARAARLADSRPRRGTGPGSGTATRG